MIIAVVGCTHGELKFIYATIEKLEKDNNFKVDLLICCGDFECVRYGIDNECLNVPNKYKKEENDFRDYFTGKKKAKVLTIFVGGNHEAVNVLKQLYYGGWVAPNIYFLGYSNIHNINNFRICSLSGIYKKYNFYKKYYEHYPYNEISKVSSYHVRKYEIEKLKLIREKVDIVITHDWPNNIEKHGDVNDLVRKKFHFHSDVYNNTLGNPHTEFLLNKLKPHFWFSSHLHVKYSAIFLHNDKKNYTRFLSLDKAEPRKHFIQILNIEKRNNIPYLRFDHLPKSTANNDTDGKSVFFNEDYEKLLQHVEDVQRRDAEEDAKADTDKVDAKADTDKVDAKADTDKVDAKADTDKVDVKGDTDKVDVKGDTDKVDVKGDTDKADAKDKNCKNPDDGIRGSKVVPKLNEKGATQSNDQLNNKEWEGAEAGNVEAGNTEEGNTEEGNAEAGGETNGGKDPSEERKQFYICYDEEWLAILKANHHLISVSNNKDYNLEKLKYPSKEDFEYINEKLKKLEKISIKGKDYYCVHGYKNPSYKHLWEQRQIFLNRFDFQELNIYNEFEKDFFAEEVRKIEAGLPLEEPKVVEDDEVGEYGEAEHVDEMSVVENNGQYNQFNQYNPYDLHSQHNPYDLHSQHSPYDLHSKHNLYNLQHSQHNPYDLHSQNNPYDLHSQNNPYDLHSQNNPYDLQSQKNQLNQHKLYDPIGENEDSNPNVQSIPNSENVPGVEGTNETT